MSTRPSRVRRLRIRKALETATLAVIMVGIGIAYLAIEKQVTLVVDGRPLAVRTTSGDVEALLDAEGILLSNGIVVVPPPATPLADGMTVVVRTDPRVGEAPRRDVGVWVVDGVGMPLGKLAAVPTEDSSSASGLVGSSRMVAATVVVQGKGHDVLTNAASVRELLTAMGIHPDGHDRVRPLPSAPLSSATTVRYVDIDVWTDRTVIPIPFETRTRYTDALDPGAIRLLRHGVVGRELRLVRVRSIDGKIVSRTPVETRVVRPAIDEVRLAGRALETVASGTQTGEGTWYYARGDGYTAAHPWLPFGTVVTVTNLANGASVQVVINDRGPFGGRIIDLSPKAFEAITGNLPQGICQVRLDW